MNRYIQSFIIASFVYTSLFASFFIDFDKKMGNEVKTPTYKKINLNSYKVAKEKPQPKIQPKEKPKPQKPKKVVKKEPPKPKKAVKKKVTPKKIQKVAAVKKEVVKTLPKPKAKEKKTPVEPAKAVKVAKKTNIIKKQYSVKDKEVFLNYIRQSIEKNKNYPKVAQRRGIEGKVEIAFRICEKGTLKNLNTKASHKYFDETTKHAIQSIFPLNYSLHSVKLPMDLNLVVEYKLR